MYGSFAKDHEANIINPREEMRLNSIDTMLLHGL
jgi:hypothetical protein